MRNLLHPRWLFVINTAPIVLLFLLFFSQYNIIHTLLKEDEIDSWIHLTITLSFLGISNFIYAVVLEFKKQKVSVIYGFIALVCYIGFIYFYLNEGHNIIPFSIPRWMISGNLELYPATFLMPTLLYSILIIVVHFTPENKDKKAWKSFLGAISVPLICYLFIQLILPLWKGFEDIIFSKHVGVVLFTSSTLLFLFFLLQWVYILISRKAQKIKELALLYKIPFTILFPILGLALNNGTFKTQMGLHGVFGDFSNHWFYILALVNGLLICWPAIQNKSIRLLIFLGKSITLVYTLYFLVVFLPYFPLSIIAILIFGAGFLMLTPLVLMVIHVENLVQDYRFLKANYEDKLLKMLLILGLLVLPSIITIQYKKDRIVLHETLDYIYSPDYNAEYKIDTTSIRKTLSLVKIHKENNRVSFENDNTPYLSAYYKWMVLDNLTLSDRKINTIEKIFFDQEPIELRSEQLVNKEVDITGVSSTSTYDPDEKVWHSWVDLEITNHNNNNFQSEYATTLDLPEGCWISNYYLYVGDRKEYGLLAEKKAAMWVFSQIRNIRKDPGLLYYLTGNKVAFRVFPFAKKEVRKTGIEFTHKEPITITFDQHQIKLGNKEMELSEIVELEQIAYIPSLQKKKLPSIKRKPYFHFLLDVSLTQEEAKDRYTQNITSLVNQYPHLVDGAKISYVNTYTQTMNWTSNWSENLNTIPCEGGFYLDYAIKSTLVKAHQNNDNRYPIFVVLTNSIGNAIVKNDFADLAFTYPESEQFYVIDQNGIVNAHSLAKKVKNVVEYAAKIKVDTEVKKFTFKDQSIAYLPQNNKGNLAIKKDLKPIQSEVSRARDWEAALIMQGQWYQQQLHPEEADQEWLSLVKNSFTAQMMTPVTSFIVVEDEAQKAMILKKQEEVLSGKRALDLSENIDRMSEPNLLLIIGLLFCIIGYRNYCKKIKL